MKTLELDSHLDVLRLWTGPAALARALNLDFGVVRQWYLREKIPTKYWPRLVDLVAEQHQLDLDCRRLAEIVAARDSTTYPHLMPKECAPCNGGLSK